jgi:hypothetical protein
MSDKRAEITAVPISSNATAATIQDSNSTIQLKEFNIFLGFDVLRVKGFMCSS